LDNSRKGRIVKLLEQKGEVHLNQLKALFPNVSEMTLRRDLISLENEGRVVRTYGGAVSTRNIALIKGEEDAYSRRAAENIEAKMIIARMAVNHIEKGRSVYLDAGSTIMAFARELPDESYSIVTSGANIALELLKKSNTSVVVLGGLMNRNTLSMSGPSAISFLDTINIDLAFMAASGFSIENGFTVSNLYESDLKRKVVSRANKVIMLVDSSKVGRDLAFTYAYLKDVDIWICEKELPTDIQKEAKKAGTKLVAQ
jgi:DeoR/GlpR family transcriptional regulator of sugar metabolism